MSGRVKCADVAASSSVLNNDGREYLRAPHHQFGAPGRELNRVTHPAFGVPGREWVREWVSEPVVGTVGQSSSSEELNRVRNENQQLREEHQRLRMENQTLKEMDRLRGENERLTRELAEMQRRRKDVAAAALLLSTPVPAMPGLTQGASSKDGNLDEATDAYANACLRRELLQNEVR